MKKLFLMAAAMCLGLAAQAEPELPIAVHWSATSVEGVDGNFYSGPATLYLSTESLRSGTTQHEEIDSEMVNGALDTLRDTREIDCSTAHSSRDDMTYSAYYTMADANGNLFTSDTLNGEIDLSAFALERVELSLEFGRSGSWKAAPEPTSGLLMLFGLAGLALTRKRA